MAFVYYAFPRIQVHFLPNCSYATHAFIFFHGLSSQCPIRSQQQNRGNEDQQRVDEKYNSDPNFTKKFSRARRVLDLPRQVARDFEIYLESKPLRLLSAGATSILLGFFAATAAATFIGAVADWDPLAAGVLIIWTELITKNYYTSENPSTLFRILNAFRIGITYGLIIDALKLAG